MRNFTFVFAGLALIAGSYAFAAQVDRTLEGFARGEGMGRARVLVMVKGQGSPLRPNRYDRVNVIRYYKDSARRSVLPVMTSLQNHQLDGVEVRKVYWINGAILADVTPEGLKNLANHPSVTKIYRNARLRWDPGLFLKPADLKNPNQSPLDSLNKNESADYAFPSIGLDKLIKEKPQLNGRGVIIGAVDTGVDGSHPALQGKVPLFYNGQTKTTTPPKDFDQHGTHVSGTIVGGDRDKITVGIAPAAKLVMAGVVTQGFDAMLEGMEWFLDVEKNPAVAQKIRAVGCSWNAGGAPDLELFYRAIAAWEAAGILPIFSAGNAGMNGITPPHEYPGTLAVAAYDSHGKVAPFSSRGPGHYKGQNTQKPDLAAPGVDIVSSIPGGKFEKMSGTSMAQPHVTGVTALLLQINPNFNPAQLREILVKSLVPAEGQQPGQWSPEYGFGRLNAYNAVKLAAARAMETNAMYLNSMTFNMQTPSEVDAQGFDEASLGDVDGEVDQYVDSEADASNWVASQDLYK